MSNTALFSFTPSLMDGEALEAIFVQRKDLAADLVERVRESALTDAKLHTLVIGARGMGKTHLASLVYHRIQAMPDLEEKLLIAWLREEEWGVTSFLDLLLRILRALAEKDPTVEERMEALYDLSAEEAEVAGTRLLNELIGERTLWLISENLDDLFSGLGEQGQQHLRAFLQTHGNCTVLATSPRLFNGVQRRTAPFYGFFRPVHLNELTTEEAQQLLINVAQWQQKDDLADFLKTSIGQTRVKTVQHLAGGNPRIYIIFADFLTYQSLDELVSPFMSLVDALTPYYQSRMQYLSPQQRKIVELLCEKKYAVSVKIIAQRCFMTSQTASSQLKDLREKGYVKVEAIGRESFYEITEPLMRICLGVKKERGEPLRLMVDFLRVWYPKNELQIMHQALLIIPIRETLMTRYLEQALDDEKLIDEDPRIQACLDEIQALINQNKYRHSLSVAEKLLQIRDSWIERERYATCLSHLGHYQEALINHERAIELNPDYHKAWHSRGLDLENLERDEEALSSYDKAIQIKSDLYEAWNNRGDTLIKLGRNQEALTSYDKALQINPDFYEAWDSRGLALLYLKRNEQAYFSFVKALEIKPDYLWAWIGRGLALGQLRRYEEAVASYQKALEINPTLEILQKFHEKALAFLTDWTDNYKLLESLPNNKQLADIEFLERTVRSLLISPEEIQNWHLNIDKLVNALEGRFLLFELGAALVKTVDEFVSQRISEYQSIIWRDAWTEVVGQKSEFELPLRLLNTALDYKQAPDDPRVFLELPSEERKILQQALGIEYKST